MRRFFASFRMTTDWIKSKRLQALLYEEEDEVFDAVGVTPLVVVPANDLARVGSDDLGELRVEDAGGWGALEVGGGGFFVGVAENAFERAFAGFFYGLVDAGDRDRLFRDEGEVDDRDLGRGDADSEAVELAIHLGNDELEGLGGAGA